MVEIKATCRTQYGEHTLTLEAPEEMFEGLKDVSNLVWYASIRSLELAIREMYPEFKVGEEPRG